MNCTRIIAIRHGETAWNVDTRVQGQLDIGLNPHGQWQALRLAEALADEAIDAIYSSDLQRALHTAQAIARRQQRHVQTHTGLRERGFGTFEGKTHAEIAAQWPDQSRLWHLRAPDWAPPGGESLLVMRQRVSQTLDELARAHLGQQIVLLAHGGVMDQLYRLGSGQDLQTPRTWHLGNAAINRLLWTPESLTLIGWGEVQHLEQDPGRLLQARETAAPAGCSDVG